MPLVRAVQAGNEAIVRLLCESPGIQVNALHSEPRRSRCGNSPTVGSALHVAFARNHVGIQAYLMQRSDVDVNLPDEMGRSALYTAASQGNVAAVERLLAHPKIDVNCKFEVLRHDADVVVMAGSIGETALYLALKPRSRRERYCVVDPDDPDPDTTRETHEKAAQTLIANKRQIALVLLSHKDIDVNLAPKVGPAILDDYTPLEFALYHDLRGVAGKLIALDAVNVNSKPDNNTSSDSSGSDDDTATHENDEPTIESVLIVLALLARSDLDVNYTPPVSDTSVPAHDSNNCDGHTPLILACKSGLKSVVHQLCQRPTLQSSVTLLLGDLPLRVEGGSVVRRHDHLHTWSQYLDVGTPVDKGVRLEAVQRLIRHPDLRHHPSVARELAMTTDREGRTVLQTTDAATRDLLNGYLFFCGRYEIVDGPPIHISATAVVVHAFDHGLFKQLFDLHATGAFDGASKDGPNLTEHEYLRHCSHAYGGSMRVAIKFMRHGADHARELDARTHLDAEFVVGILPMADTSTFADHVRSLVLHGNLNMCEFPNVLVMPAADRSLEDIFLKERPDDTKIRPMMRDVALALAHLHGHGMIHGDLKKLNILRVHQTLQLIDLDAATRVGDDIGSKFSSGILPPGNNIITNTRTRILSLAFSYRFYLDHVEMFVQVTSPTEVDTYETYWKHADRVEWWPKVQPRGHGGWVVRSFRGRAKNVPYQLVKASPAIDMWAFGCMLFQLYSEAELVPTDRNQDADDDAMDRAATWTADALGRRIRSKVSNGLAADLIQRLLVVEPENRMGVRQVLDHAYFHGTDDASVLGIKLDQLQVQVARGFNAIGTKLDTVVDLTKENVNQLATAKRDLMRGIFQATEVTVPTSFVLLPFNLVVHDPHDETAEDVMVKTASFLQRVVDMGDKFMQAAKANKAIGATVRLVAPGDPLYLYLIDEVMGTPVSAGVYPIRIDTKSDEYVRFMTVAMPYIQTGFKCLNWANTAVGWLKVLGVPSLDSDVMTRVATSIESATKSSSVFDFDVLQAAVEAQDAGAPVEQIRGAALRQLERFFQTFDATGDYAGLERTYASNGQVLWTTKDTIAKIELNRRENVAPKTQESTAPLKRQGGLTAQDIYLAMLKNETTGDVEEASSASSVRGRNDEVTTNFIGTY
ncbi:hypothetical protein B5M09_002742 [Aphanomyces astaci]|uniref:Protein kinase domain-containing protein n=1 Tax=Aphanomyces astaci TaxID=112090 RepID=A0A425DAR4_APHAT|nr:hypothetical protein B5M09_002742 [Aphanomyces astaci]